MEKSTNYGHREDEKSGLSRKTRENYLEIQIWWIGVDKHREQPEQMIFGERAHT